MKVPAFLIFAILIGGQVSRARADFSNGQEASQAIGQIDFSSNAFLGFSVGFSSPQEIAIDPKTGKLFVSDVDNNRVLRFPNVDSLAAGEGFEAVFGQPNATNISGDLSATRMSGPAGLFFDLEGRLWVCDRNNHRVLRFDDAATIPTGSPANQVLGQANFTTSVAPVTQNRMFNPAGVCVAQDGTVWVADTENQRVLRFDAAATKGDGPNADGLLGQANFTSPNNGTSRSTMFRPVGVCVDEEGTLYVSDSSNNRILIFVNAAKRQVGVGLDADGVLGQTLFTTNTAGRERELLNTPLQIDVAGGLLAIADSSNLRCVLFRDPGHLPNGAPAAFVLGKPVFTTHSDFTTSGRNTFEVQGAKFDAAGRIYLSDTSNNRILRFDPDVLQGNSFQSRISSQGTKGKAVYQIQNTGSFAADYALTLRLKGKAKVQVVVNGKNVLAAAKSGQARTGIIAPSGRAQMLVKAKGTKGGQVKTTLLARSVAYPTITSGGSAKVKL